MKANPRHDDDDDDQDEDEDEDDEVSNQLKPD